MVKDPSVRPTLWDFSVQFCVGQILIMVLILQCGMNFQEYKRDLHGEPSWIWSVRWSNSTNCTQRISNWPWFTANGSPATKFFAPTLQHSQTTEAHGFLRTKRSTLESFRRYNGHTITAANRIPIAHKTPPAQAQMDRMTLRDWIFWARRRSRQLRETERAPPTLKTSNRSYLVWTVGKKNH